VFERTRANLTNGWHEVLQLVRPHRKRLALGLLLMVVGRLAGLVVPLVSKYFVDDVIGKGREDLLVPLVLAAGAATLVDSGCSFALTRVLGVAAQRAIADMRKSIQAHVNRLPIRFFDSTQTGVLISRIMQDADGIRNLLGTGLAQLGGGLATSIIALAMLFYVNWRITTVCLIVLGAFGGAMVATFARLRPLFRERGRLNAEVTGRLAESLGGIRIVKAYIAEKREERIFAHGIHRLFRNIAQAMTAVSAVTALGHVVVGAIGAIIIIMGGRAIFAHTMTLGDLLMYLFLAGLLAMPLVQIASVGVEITDALAALDRIREIKRLGTEDAEDERRQPLSAVQGDLHFEDVSFEYEPGVPVLWRLSFYAPVGSTTALVGPSGSGKSTLISLVMALNRPTSGRVLVDGHDLAGVRLRDYRAHLCVVLQDNFIFDGTVAENIRFARPHATFDEVQRVSRIAHCAEFVERFPNRYETIVGERGVKLSGGQRQRIAIARAILADPRILIFDEATSSLDAESETLIQDGLRNLRQGRTTLVIAHRLSTIRSADQILVLDAGQIVERGTHEELLASNGRYFQLYQKQYRIERERMGNSKQDAVVQRTPVG